jgi:TatD DNase family protein
MPNIDHTSVEGMLRLEEEYPGKCRAMMGLHPCYVTASFEKELYIVEDWLARRPFLAVGEIGLDFYWSLEFRTQQEAALITQLELAKKYRRPVVIHCRNSFRETAELVSNYADRQLGGIFHCFSGNLDDARVAIEMGFLLGIGGVSTFKNGGLDKVLPYVDLSHIVLETDAPYLAPVPYRGKRNEPAYLPLIAQRVADLKHTTLSEVVQASTANARRLLVPQ